jgi:bilin biosynthesis protein
MLPSKPPIAFAATPLPLRLAARALHPSLCSRRPRRAATFSAAPTAHAPPLRGTQTTEETFAEDAGRDLFFAAMNADTALGLLASPLGGLDSRDDRFIAAERLKFFPSDEVVRGIVEFVRRFEGVPEGEVILEDRVARRKCVETLGRFKGAFCGDEVVRLLTWCLRDKDPYMVEVAVWALAETGLEGRGEELLEEIAAVLGNGEVSRRTVIQALMRARHMPALDRLKALTDDKDLPTASAALTAVCVLTGDHEGMRGVVGLLRDESLTVRRAAMEDVTLARDVGALEAVAVAPNSLVLRARTVRVLLEEKFGVGGDDWEGVVLDEETAALVDRLIWDHPTDLDLLGMRKDTKKARDVGRNVRQLYKNDAVYPYLASRTLGEDHRGGSGQGSAGVAVLKSFTDQPYFDYFGAYHVFKTLGWLLCHEGVDVLLDNAENLPPRFFNHQAGAITSLAELGDPRAVRIFEKVAVATRVWELKYACLLAAERLGLDGGRLRANLAEDQDWLVRARARCPLDFGHLRSGF